MSVCAPLAIQPRWQVTGKGYKLTLVFSIQYKPGRLSSLLASLPVTACFLPPQEKKAGKFGSLNKSNYLCTAIRVYGTLGV